MAAVHETLVVEVVDPRELELPDIGAVTLVDPESGHRREVWTSDRRLRRAYAEAVAAHRDAVAAAVRSSRAGARAAAHRPGLGARPRPPRRRSAARKAGPETPSPDPQDTSDEPGLPDLAAAPAAGGRCCSSATCGSRRRRSRYAVRFATLPMLERLAPTRPGWRRRVPAIFLLLTFVALCVAAARPQQVDEQVPRERARP